jgi:hypothetical protein
MVAHLDSKSLAEVGFSVTLKLIIMDCLNLQKFNLKIPPLEKSDVVRSINRFSKSNPGISIIRNVSEFQHWLDALPLSHLTSCNCTFFYNTVEVLTNFWLSFLCLTYVFCLEMSVIWQCLRSFHCH